ncbi:MAG: PQQ-dependent sugar dehydrogenase [bacterium]|nr:PQQ-dependent sugar dehydrogenase [bacterium]
MKTSDTQTAAVIDVKNLPRLSILAENLEVPWALVFLPDKSILFTERAGRVRYIDKKGNLLSDPIDIIEDVTPTGEGGLLGITTHPDFSKNHFVYLYYTYSSDNSETLNRVVRFKFENKQLSEKTTIVDAIPGALFHNGGRIKFGPDKFLYITTGDSQNPSLAQDTKSKAGKILRVDSDGKPAPGNPFENEVFSYGHRNPQGIAWDNSNRLWETEHGASTLDELNIIEKGKNYGWQIISGDKIQNGMETPIINSGPDTWAPSGTAYLNNSIFFAGLRGQALYKATINGTKVDLKEFLKGEMGRIREVVVGPDNLLYITTSNGDGRGIPDGTDDKIIRVNPDKL